ncbi:hypothetical protein NBRC116586_05980 [Pseudooceanicola nitratireducens]
MGIVSPRCTGAFSYAASAFSLDLTARRSRKDPDTVPHMGAKRPGIIGNAEWMTHIGVHSRSRPRDCKAESVPERRHWPLRVGKAQARDDPPARRPAV